MQRLLVSIAMTTLFASPVLAQSQAFSPDMGPYIGAGIGHAKLDNETLDWLDENGVNTDDTDISYKLFAGYQFNSNFAIEAGYVDFGSFTASGSNGADNADLKLSAEGFTAALVGKLPIQSGFSVYGKLGMIAWDADLTLNATIQGQSYRATASEDGTDPFYGIGAEYVVNQIVMRAELERYDISDSGEDYTIDMISASLGYHF
ncbi:outer membrane beta-barrel protein [Halomonas sp. LR3S48]|uniref:outer membrane beta-barrel protein n=1 Tax=Halomonas sp. LR3S48 TaxID=2982694 RepID=UPI0021E485DB|nr:outer membrane beta-barrel protein [Halomonas sp. LR3S48]UYG03435.1 outer membrane beta-barrel protein [Halomonas sp. LR3S48]